MVFVCSRSQLQKIGYSSLWLCLLFQPAFSAGAEKVLERYVAKDDLTFSWTIKEKRTVDKTTIYDLVLVSQTWRKIVWDHQLSLVVPEKENRSSYALLFITGGSNREGQPNWRKEKDEELSLIGRIANTSGSIVAILRQVPNQPLFEGKREDGLIAYTFEQFMKTKDDTWPLLLPMVKSAVKAMDAVQQFSEKELGRRVEKFVVAGASKRGWTTWLTGAVDPRVAAIAPMVIDTLNMEQQMDYELESYGKYSEQIQDYVRMDFPKKLKEPEGKALLSIVDPYSYRDRLTMPKLLFMGTNDLYWTVDAVKWYFDDLKGEKFIHYVPNAGHDLGGGRQAVKALAAFFATCVKNLKQPELSWTIAEKKNVVEMQVKADAGARKANLWSAVSNDRDFRDNRWSGAPYKTYKTTLSRPITIVEKWPKEGYKAFYMEVVFPSPLGGMYSKCTRVYVIDKHGLIDKRKE